MVKLVAEETVLFVIGIVMLSYLLPFSLMRNMVATLIVATALIAIIILRSISWHDGGTPYDGVLLIGIIVSAIYLVSFFAFERSTLTTVVLSLFAIYYVLMAVLLAMFSARTNIMPAHTQTVSTRATKTRVTHHYDPTHDPAFRRGLDPIVEHAPVHHEHVMRSEEIHSSSAFKRGIEHIPEHAPPYHVPQKRTLMHRIFKRNVEPLRELQPPRPGKVHEAKFTQGMTPLHDLEEELHKLEVYSVEQKAAEKKIITKTAAKKPARSK